MSLVGLAISAVNRLIAFVVEYYRWGIAAIAVIVLAIILNRIWPDRASILFIVRNVRVTRQKLADVREQLASIVGYEIHETQRAIANQQLKLQSIQLELARLQQTVNIKSISMLVGKKLQAIEKDHMLRLGTLSSEQAREALRRVTEKEINDLLQSIHVKTDGMPEFHFKRNDDSPDD